MVTSHDGLYTGSCGWYLNDGSGTFTDGSGFVGHSTGYGSFNSVRADLNQDGYVERTDGVDLGDDDTTTGRAALA